MNKPQDQAKTSTDDTWMRIIQQMSHRQLQDFVINLAQQNPEICKLLIDTYQSAPNGFSRAEGLRHVAQIVERALKTDPYDPEGYFDYPQIYDAIKVFLRLDLVQTASNLIDEGLCRAEAACEQLLTEVQKRASSNPTFSLTGFDDLLLSPFRTLIAHERPAETTLRVVSFLVNLAPVCLPQNRQFMQAAIQLAMQFAQDSESQKILDLGLTLQHRQTGQHLFLDLKLEWYEQQAQTEAAEQLLLAHVYYDRFRDQLINRYAAHHDYEKAIELAHEGIRQDTSSQKKLSAIWYEHLSTLYQLTQQPERVLEFARACFFSYLPNKQKYFELMKAFTPAENWSVTVDEILADVQASTYYNENWVYQILSWTARYQALCHALGQQTDLDCIQNYLPQLIETCPQETVAMLKQVLRRKLSEHCTRVSVYEMVDLLVHYTHTLQGIQGIELAQTLASEFRDIFGLQDALAKAGLLSS